MAFEIGAHLCMVAANAQQLLDFQVTLAKTVDATAGATDKQKFTAMKSWVAAVAQNRTNPIAIWNALPAELKPVVKAALKTRLASIRADAEALVAAADADVAELDKAV